MKTFRLTSAIVGIACIIATGAGTAAAMRSSQIPGIRINKP